MLLPNTPTADAGGTVLVSQLMHVLEDNGSTSAAAPYSRSYELVAIGPQVAAFAADLLLALVQVAHISDDTLSWEINAAGMYAAGALETIVSSNPVVVANNWADLWSGQAALTDCDDWRCALWLLHEACTRVGFRADSVCRSQCTGSPARAAPKNPANQSLFEHGAIEGMLSPLRLFGPGKPVWQQEAVTHMHALDVLCEGHAVNQSHLLRQTLAGFLARLLVISRHSKAAVPSFYSLMMIVCATLGPGVLISLER